MRTLRPCLVVFLSLLSIVSAVSAVAAPRQAQVAPTACPSGTCTLYLPLLKYEVDPVLIEPLQGAQLTTVAPSLTWRPSTTGTHTIQVSTEAGFPVSSSFALSTTKQVRLPLPEVVSTALTSNLKFATTYFWRVGVVLPQGDTAFSSVQSFTTPPESAIQLPGLVSIIAPLNYSTVTGYQVLLKWGPVGGALVFRIRMFDANGNAFDPGTVQVPGNVTSYWIKNMPKGKYTWKIKVITAAGWGPYNDDYTFTLR